MKKFSQQGFTLLEMMAVITIMGILLALIVPRMGPTPGLQLNGEYQRIDALSQIARTRAVATGEPQRIAFVTASPEPDFVQSTIFVMEPYMDEDTDELKWAVATAPKFLDEGVFFDPEASTGLLESDIVWNKKEMSALVVEFLPSGLCAQENARLHLAIGIRNGNSVVFPSNQDHRSALLFTRLGSVVPAPEPEQP